MDPNVDYEVEWTELVRLLQAIFVCVIGILKALWGIVCLGGRVLHRSIMEGGRSSSNLDASLAATLPAGDSKLGDVSSSSDTTSSTVRYSRAGLVELLDDDNEL